MKKSIVILGLTATVLWFASCDSNKEVKQFAADLAEAVKGGDKAKVEMMYPDVSESDSLSITFQADSVVVEKTETDNQYVVKLNSLQSMTVEKDQEGKLRVLNSKGLFAYEPGVVEFCRSVGCYDDALCDKDNSERMRDSAFVDYLNAKAEEIIKSKVRLEQKDYWVDYATEKVSIAIYNDSEFDLPDGSYVVTASVYFQGDGPAFLRSSHEYSEAIAKGDAAYYVVPATIDEMTYVRSSFALNHADMNALQRLYHPTGNEYQDYLGQK